MVYINEEVYIDLEQIFEGLYKWAKVYLSLEFMEEYIDDLLDQCYAIENTTHHFEASYHTHKQYGDYVYRFRRNPHTLWYIIYNMNEGGDIFVNKVLSNHRTTK